MTVATPDGVPRGDWLATRADLVALAALERDAADLGWRYQQRESSWSWTVTSPDGTRAGGYDPPSSLGAGRVAAFDSERTLTLTGVANHAAAAVLVRQFLGWPA